MGTNGNGTARAYLKLLLSLLAGAVLAYLGWLGNAAMAAVSRVEVDEKIRRVEDRVDKTYEALDRKLDSIRQLIIDHSMKENQPRRP